MYHIDILIETKAALSVDSIGKFSCNDICMKFRVYKLFYFLIMKDQLNSN